MDFLGLGLPFTIVQKKNDEQNCISTSIAHAQLLNVASVRVLSESSEMGGGPLNKKRTSSDAKNQKNIVKGRVSKRFKRYRMVYNSLKVPYYRSTPRNYDFK